MWIHRLSNINREDKTADCAHCGEGIDIKLEKGVKARCRTPLREYQKTDRAKESVARAKKKARELGKAYVKDNAIQPHGMTLQEAREYREGKACEVCGETDNSKLHVDHDHVTGRVRGVLCRNHNLALGLLGDNVEHIRGLLDYLERTQET